ncbi:hypothetical protein AVEN_260086-1 [Araneus ventricosus]|uniref:Uncharacterized protein n=1 Tax=Araneus ventricosus TaxID=182803 RepID=A0A4Y2G269_ARAVE|nr:hypothetical protein AVEN_260086-1 [Araneus ventricosus]
MGSLQEVHNDQATTPNHLLSLNVDEGYSNWFNIKERNCSIPEQPGLFQLKTRMATCIQFVKSSQNLNKELDTLISKNKSNCNSLATFFKKSRDRILVRYKTFSLFEEANLELSRVLQELYKKYGADIDSIKSGFELYSACFKGMYMKAAQIQNR